MKTVETKGDVVFFEDEKGKMYYQIKDGDIKKVKNGSISYEHVKTVNGYSIKYNTNGVYGFSVFKDNNPLEDGIWSLEDAERIANEL